MLCAQDRAFAALLTGQFERDLAVSREITLEEWSSRPATERAREVAARLLRREL